MIYVDRTEVAAPAILGAERVKALLQDAAEHFRSKSPEVMQSRFKLERKPLFSPEVRSALAKLFHSKCAYCECLIDVSDMGDVEHFRPVQGTVDLDGNFLPAHYWWLAYEWRNLYLSCVACNRSKRSRFPVSGRRARLETPYEKLDRERPFLLDPCNDKPGRFLVFGESGEVASDDERGKVTIEILGLNRRDLVAARRARYRELHARWESWRTSKSLELQKDIMAMMRPEAEFAALSRQFVLQWTLGGTGMLKLWERFSSWLDGLRDDHREVSTSRRRETVESYRRFASKLEDYSLDSDADAEGLHLIDQTVERIEVKNLRAIRDLDIEIASGGTDTAPWTLLLGENGTGKSTILQAIALAFAGAKYRASLEVDAASFVRHGCRSGHIRLHVRGFSAPLELTFRTTGPRTRRLIGSDERPKVPILAYGATRLLPRPGIPMPLGTRYARIDNLFNPFVPLADATQWLLGMSEAQFNHTARTLKDLLQMSPNVLIRRNRRRRRVEIPSLNVSSLTDLSAGYQSMLALSADIMMVLGQHFEAMEAATGIVLLDEIGAHLHPRWRMRAVNSLRAAFPNIQFIATTHDPLCLRGIGDGEVTVLKRGAKGNVYAVSDLPSISGMRVDQLLTSEHFGLSSTVDPDLEDTFERYYALLRKGDLNEAESEEMEAVRKTLASHRVMGATRRERLMLEAIDRHLAAEIPTAGDERQAKQALESDLARIIEQVRIER